MGKAAGQSNSRVRDTSLHSEADPRMTTITAPDRREGRKQTGSCASRSLAHHAHARVFARDVEADESQGRERGGWETTKDSESDFLETRVEVSCVRAQGGAVPTGRPVRRVEIPKGDGKTPPARHPDSRRSPSSEKPWRAFSAQSTSRTSWSCPTDSVLDATHTKRFVRFEATSWRGR